jgi:hypothetical protein
MRNHEEITREVESRNDFRAEVGLPLVSVPKEVDKIYKAKLWQDFLDWCKTYPLRDKIAEEVLQAARKERGEFRVACWVEAAGHTVVKSGRGCVKSGEKKGTPGTSLAITAKEQLKEAVKKHNDAVAFGYVLGMWVPAA